MMQGKILKEMVNMIPDDAVVTLNGNPIVNIVEVKVETTPFDYLSADLKLTAGYQLCMNGFIEGLFDQLRKKI